MSKTTRSAAGKIWQAREIDDRLVLTIMQKYNLEEFIARILVARDIPINNIENFLEPRLKNNLVDPFHLKDMEKAVNRIIDALNANELICILADYDVDGATSASLLKNILRDLGIEAIIYVPDRIKEGYGPSSLIMQKLKNIGIKLVITVDCGSLAFEACNTAKELNLDLVIIDHHITSTTLPDVVALVNPNRFDEDSTYGYLAAVGVTFLVCMALVSRLKSQNNMQASRVNLLNYLDLVALGTVCDVVPLKDLNRAFVYQGLKILQNTNNIGLKALIESAALTEPARCYHLGYVLGPRINAGGRVGKSESGCKLLTTKCSDEALSISARLQEYNVTRQKIEAENYLEATSQVIDKNITNFLFVKGSWHQGVVGLIASKLKESYALPSFAVTFVDDNLAKGSCRSINGVDIGSIILRAKSSGIILEGGGHAMAAGFSLKRDNIENFSNYLQEEFNKHQDKINSHSICEYDAEIISNSLSDIMAQQLKRLAPFGAHNPEPIFKINNLFIFKTQILATKHIKCMLLHNKSTNANKMLEAIAFNSAHNTLGHILLSPNKAQEIAVIGKININYFRGEEKLQLIIQDIIV